MESIKYCREAPLTLVSFGLTKAFWHSGKFLTSYLADKYIELKGNTIWCGDEMGIAYA